jgi:hypothetical protein
VSSKTSVNTVTDTSALTATDSASAYRLGEGAGSTVNVSPTDLGAITGALNYSSDATSGILSTIGEWAKGTQNLATQSLNIVSTASADSNKQVAAAYSTDRGAINWTSIIIVVAITVAVIAGVVTLGGKK